MVASFLPEIQSTILVARNDSLIMDVEGCEVCSQDTTGRQEYHFSWSISPHRDQDDQGYSNLPAYHYK